MLGCSIAAVLLLANTPISAQERARHHFGSPSEALEEWALGEPLIAVGQAVDSVFFGEIGDGAFMPNGGFVVTDLQSREVMIFSDDGELRLRTGGEGDGPGEYLKPASVEMGPRDSILVFDQNSQRLTVLMPDGEVARSDRLVGAFAMTGAVGRFSNGRWFARSRNTNSGAGAGQITRDTVAFMSLSPSLEWGEAIARVPGAYTSATNVGRQRGYRTSPFTPDPQHDTRGECLYVTPSDVARIEIFDSRGKPVTVLTGSQVPKVATDDDLEVWMQFYLDNLIPEGQHQLFRDVIGELPYPPHVPLYSDLRVDDSGLIWLQLYELPFGLSDEWSVLGHSATVVARVSAEEPLRILDISGDRVLARRVVEFGIEEVVVLPLERPAGSEATADFCSGP